jgi:Ca2+-binding EF-hand superfamily protein
MSCKRSSKLERFLGFLFSVAGLWGVALPSLAYANGVEMKFLEMDTNSDGRVSRDEHAQWASRMFERADANRDRVVTTTETTAPNLKKVSTVKRFDSDGDGALKRDEYAAAAQAMFDKMDTDHDGYLTRAELKAGHDKDVYETSK